MQDIISELACYTTKENINQKGTLLVEVLYNHNKIGEYKRNYSIMYDTFYPFFLDGKYYALYSPNYTTTRIMSLPDCKDLGGEEPHSNGFCPTGYYVPYLDAGWYKTYQEYLDNTDKDKIIGPMGQFGFVCGCVWGDDVSWKIQFLDLTRAAEGIITRDQRFGYRELLGGAEQLKNSVKIHPFDQSEYLAEEICIEINSFQRYTLNGKQYNIHPYIECINCNTINYLKVNKNILTECDNFRFVCTHCKKSYSLN